MFLRSLSIAGVLALCASPLDAQLLYSQAVPRSGGALLISVSLTGAQPGASLGIALSATSRLTLNAPASVQTDASGYAGFQIQASPTAATNPPEAFTLTLSGAALPGGPLTRDYLLETANSQVASAWPDYIQIQGVFCSPATSAAAMLEVDRSSDLDGDGYYGDVNVERDPSGFDPIDYPNEFSMDVNAHGSSSTCLGGNPFSVFWPGSANRKVAFIADDRVVSATCSFQSRLNYLLDFTFSPQFNGRGPAVLMTGTDGWSGNIMLCRDSNQNGVISDPEITELFVPANLVSNERYQSDALAIDPTSVSRLYWICRQRPTLVNPTNNQGVYRIDDINGDDVIGSGEWIASWNGNTAQVQVEGQNIDPSNFDRVHVDGLGGVILHDRELGTIFRWLDGNNNGIAETGEVANWMTYDTASTLTVNAEFANPASGFPSFAGVSNDLNLLSSVPGIGTGGTDMVFVGSRAGGGTTQGWVFRCDDLNSDGDVNDTGEVLIFAHGPTALAPQGFPPNFIAGMDVAGVDVNGNGVIEPTEVYLYVAATDGPAPSCGYTFGDLQNWRFVDLNGDGSAMSAGEHERISIHPTGAYNRGLLLLPPAHAGGFRHSFYSRSHVATIAPASCTSSQGNYLRVDYRREKLEEGTQGTPFAGNQRFELITRGNEDISVPNSSLFLGLGSSVPLPIGNCTLGLNPTLILFGFLPIVQPDTAGNAVFPAPLPDGAYGTFYVQPFTLTAAFNVVLGETAEIVIQ